MENQDRSGFVQARLPLLITAAALVVYLLTLNRWVSLSSLPAVAEIGNTESTPPISQPLRFLVFLPFRWVSPGWQPVALNALSALCASLTLGLLARTVALLPHDRTREQRQRERSQGSLLSIPAAWVPPVFATLACGLQLTFWENATAVTGEMLDLLFFAYIIRCLLEYRIDRRESWLARSALACGIAITNNYAMIGFFPVYLLALVWIKGSEFFEFRFAARMFGWGTAGLTLYLLPPLLNALDARVAIGFWQALRVELGNQRNWLLSVPRLFVLIASLTSLLPLLLIGIRWPSTFGEMSPVGAVITTVLFRLMHFFLLAAGLWVAFDAPLSMRTLVEKKLQEVDEPFSGMPFLTFYYLGAICLGYFAGYFLLVFGRETTKTWQRTPAGTRLLNRAVTLVIWLVIVGSLVVLLYRNVPIIRASDGSVLRDFARSVAGGLAGRGTVALSDDPFVLTLAQEELRQTGTSDGPLLVDTRLMKYSGYQQFLHKRFPGRWPETPPSDTPMAQFDLVYLMYQVSGLVRSNEVYYLHPSFGYYFEPLYLEPAGLVYRLALYPTNVVSPPELTDVARQANQAFWTDARPALERLTILVNRNIIDARVVGRWYSRALNWWGVELQKLGRLDDAAHAFASAHKLNPQNVAAEINLTFNQTLRAGDAKAAPVNKPPDAKFGRYRDWDTLLASNGPIDDPGIRFRLGQTFASRSLFRQAALQFIRVVQLQPDNLDARFWLANVLLAGQSPEKALEVTDEIHSRQTSQPLTATNLVELTRIEAMAHLRKGDVETSEKLLLGACRQDPQNETLFGTLIQVYVMANRLTNAMAALDDRLALKPDDVLVLLNKAYVCMKLEAYEQANAAVAAVLRKDPNNVQALLDRGAICIQTKSFKDALAPLDLVLKLQPNNQVALMNRAIANLQSGQLEAAQRDYEALQKLTPNVYRVLFGLGEIAFRRKDFPAAIKHYESYLKFADPDTEEAKQIAERLKQLKTPAGP